MSPSEFIHIKPREKCPQCFKSPDVWRERPEYSSKEMYWIGCCSLLAGGMSVAAADMIWTREVSRWRFENRYRKAL